MLKEFKSLKGKVQEQGYGSRWETDQETQNSIKKLKDVKEADCPNQWEPNTLIFQVKKSTQVPKSNSNITS
jgi:hypothetical protein